MNKKIRILAVGAAMLVGAMSTDAQAERLVILSTNDTHSQIEPDAANKGGILRRRALIDSIRGAERNVLLLDAGDAVQGTVYFNMFRGEVEFAMLDSLGYDACIMGNHEFDNGMTILSRLYSKMRTPLLNANYRLDDTPLKGITRPYIIKNYGNRRIAVVGINLLPEGMISPENSVGVQYANAAEIADLTAEYLKRVEHVDFVVVLTHVGYSGGRDNNPTDNMIVQHSHYIDMVVGGHSHTTIDPSAANSVPYMLKNADGRDVLVTQTGSKGRNLGYTAIDLDRLAVECYKLLPVDSRYDGRAQGYTGISEFLAPYRAKVDSLMNHTVCHSAEAMPNNSPKAWNLVGDAGYDIAAKNSKLKIDMAIMNAGGIRQSFPKGAVSEGLINSMFPFRNNIVVLEMTGQQLLDALAVMGGRGGDVVSRQCYVEYARQGTAKPAKILKATINGKAIVPDKTYLVATLDYLANGGDYMEPMTHCKRLYSDRKQFGERMLEYVKGVEAKGQKLKASGKPRMVNK
ncbi:MAG: bifunctional metallophosphatase/5'-nucleotidase [Muribaculaceae bacterium]